MDLNRFNKLSIDDFRLLISNLGISLSSESGLYGATRKELNNVYKAYYKAKILRLKMSKLNVLDVKKMSYRELYNIINTLNINIEGSGFNGKILKRDLISAITNNEINKIGSNFTMISSDVIQSMLKTMDVLDIISFCRTNKKINSSCTDMFWREIAYIKLDEKKLGKFNNWSQLVLELKHSPDDLYTIGKKYQYGIITKEIAEQQFDNLVTNDSLFWEDVEYDVEYNLYRYMYDHMIFHDHIPNIKEIILGYNYIKNKIIFEETKKPYLNIVLNFKQLYDLTVKKIEERYYL